MRGWKGHRHSFRTPCCGKKLTVPAPSDKWEKWDSMTVCPHCNSLFLKVVTQQRAYGAIPEARA